MSDDIEPVWQADVYKAGTLAARLTRTPSGVEFRYDDDYLDTELPAVATTLPRTSDVTLTPAGAVPPFFAGLLPEGRRLTALRQRIKTSADDELSLLVAVGQDTIGDVQVVRRGDTPQPAAALEQNLQNPRDISFAALLGDDIPLDGVGLPGVQDKVSGKTIAVPVLHKGKQTILKLSPPEHPHLVENEAYFLTLAKRAGLDCVDHSVIHDRDGMSGLIVSRFDRRTRGTPGSHGALGTPGSLPVEDGCQVLNLWPADKYNTTMANVIRALAQLCSAELLAVQTAFRQVMFAILTGNGDLHAKNLSVLHTGEEWMLTPAYDLPSTLIYGDSSLALPIDGRRRDISRRRATEFAASLGLNQKLAERTIDDMLDATGDLEADLQAGILPFDSHRIADTVAALRNRRRLLART